MKTFGIKVEVEVPDDFFTPKEDDFGQETEVAGAVLDQIMVGLDWDVESIHAQLHT